MVEYSTSYHLDLPNLVTAKHKLTHVTNRHSRLSCHHFALLLLTHFHVDSIVEGSNMRFYRVELRRWNKLKLASCQRSSFRPHLALSVSVRSNCQVCIVLLPPANLWTWPDTLPGERIGSMREVWDILHACRQKAAVGRAFNNRRV